MEKEEKINQLQYLRKPQGTFQLLRYPARKKETLRAWDAADEYILDHLEQLEQDFSSILIINDSFGVLSVTLAEHSPVMWSDSYLAQQGMLANLSRNKINISQVKFINSLEHPDNLFDLVLIKIPKSLAQLEDQLFRLKRHIKDSTVIIAAGMVKSVHTSTLKLFESIIGSTSTSRAVKKARLIFCQPDMNLPTSMSPYPSEYRLENTPYIISNHASVFSRESLDIGTRFLLQHIPAMQHVNRIIDVGCGNGIVGIIAAERNPQAQITFIDESYMAVDSAKTNFTRAFDNNRTANFLVSDCLNQVEDNSTDLILINPPFHQHNAMGDSTAWQMFREAGKALKQGGEVWVIGNRHLAYHTKLKRIFGNYVNIASNKKFAILKALKR